MKLLIENVERYDVIVEDANGTDKEMYITGVFMQADVKNRNGRIYPQDVMRREVSRYNNEVVLAKRAMGELGHPRGPQINLDRVCHVVTELRMDGCDVLGKARVLNTPSGLIVKNLHEGGVVFGVSSRALGSTRVDRDREADVVQDDFQLFAIDTVADPSAPDAFVGALMENVDWVFKNGKWTEQEIKKQKQVINEAFGSKSKEKRNAAIVHAFYNFMDSL